MPLHISVIPARRKSELRPVSVLILPSLVGRILLSVVLRAVYLSVRVSVTHFGGKLASSFEFPGSLLLLERLFALHWSQIDRDSCRSF